MMDTYTLLLLVQLWERQVGGGSGAGITQTKTVSFPVYRDKSDLVKTKQKKKTHTRGDSAAAGQGMSLFLSSDGLKLYDFCLLLQNGGL